MSKINGIKYKLHLTALISLAIFLSFRLIFLLLTEGGYFPIQTVKITATYEHISRKELETILSHYLNKGFFFISIKAMSEELQQLPWTKTVDIQKIWPDTLKIVLIEKMPVAIWNNSLITEEGEVFQHHGELAEINLPKLSGPINQEKMSYKFTKN